jgi:hypothetical protein
VAPQNNPGAVFDLILPLDQVAEAYRAFDQRRVIKVPLRPLTTSVEMDHPWSKTTREKGVPEYPLHLTSRNDNVY